MTTIAPRTVAVSTLDFLRTATAKAARDFEAFVTTLGDPAPSSAPTDSSSFTILKTDPDRRMVYGWAYVSTVHGVPVTDLQGDQWAIDDVRETAHDFIGKRVLGRLHKETTDIGEIRESLVLDRGLQQALGIDLGKEGWFVGAYVSDPATWDAVRKGELRAFSIGGVGERTPVEKDYDEAKHPRAPAGAPGGTGGEWVALEGAPAAAETRELTVVPTPEEAAAADIYRGSSRFINGAMRDYHGDVDAMLRAQPNWSDTDRQGTVALWQPYVDNLNRLFDRAPVLQRPITVYRAINFASNETQRSLAAQQTAIFGSHGALRPGTTFRDRGFVSTTLSEAQAFRWVRNHDAVVMRIHVPAGTPALAFYRMFPDRDVVVKKEVVFRDLTLRVRALRSTKLGAYGTTHQYVDADVVTR